MMALGASFSGEKLERGWFDAIALDEAEVNELEFSVNAERMEQAIRRRRGF